MATNRPDDLDELFDSALGVFKNLDLTSAAQRSENNGVEKGEFSGSMPTDVKGLGTGLPELRRKEKGNQKDMESVNETMTEPLMSKKILHEPLIDIGERYPKWLEKHKAILSSEDYERYSRIWVRSSELLEKYRELYETDPNDSTKFTSVLQKIHERGQAPKDIVQELVPDINFASLGHLSGNNGEEKGECSGPISADVQGLGMGVDLSKKNGKQMVVEKESHVSKGLDKPREQTEENVKGLESVTGTEPGFVRNVFVNVGNVATMEDLVKQFEEFAIFQNMQEFGQPHDGIVQELAPHFDFASLGNDAMEDWAKQFVELLGSQNMQEFGQPHDGIVQELAPHFDFASPGNDAMEDWAKQFEELLGSQEMQSTIETISKQLFSKEIQYETTKDIEERYLKWLEDHKASFSSEDYERYSRQCGMFRELNVVYETDPNNFTKIFDLMQKMQEYGQFPDDFVQELVQHFDSASLEHLSPEMLEQQENCCIM